MALFIAALAALVIGLTLGVLGGGGSILTVPVLVYGLDVDAKEAIAMSLFVVGTTSAFAGYRHARLKNVCWQRAPLFALAGMFGAFLGGGLATYFRGTTLLILFASMMLITAVFMWRGKKQDGAQDPAAPYSPYKIIVEGSIVGLVTGLVGAGGGFLVVPALVLMGGLSMKRAVGTSLVIISAKSFAGFAGYALHVSIDWTLVGVLSLGAVLGAFVGVSISAKLPAQALRKGFALFVALMAIWVLVKELLLT